MTALEKLLASALRTPERLEASVRGGPAGLRAARVMLEGVAFEVVQEIAAALGVDLPPDIHALAAAARGEGVPLISGWDTGGPIAVVKLYLNASDCSAAVRRRLTPSGAPIAEPHVVGFNLGAGGAREIKLYRQDADVARLAAQSGSPEAVSLAARAPEAYAAGLLSWDLLEGGALRPRAFFLAARGGAERAFAGVVSSRPGWDGARAVALLPFAPGPARSLGISLGDPSSFTVYFKSEGVAPPASLEPAAQFRTGDAEVGLFVEPAGAARAYARTARHALSYRTREGHPDGAAVEALMEWARQRIERAERSNQSPERALADAPPPAPWHAIRS